jgi:hypothetical protein
LQWEICALIFALVACTVVCAEKNHSEKQAPAVDNVVNAASFSQGAVAFAWFSQETFDAHLAIDEVISDTQKG